LTDVARWQPFGNDTQVRSLRSGVGVGTVVVCEGSEGVVDRPSLRSLSNDQMVNTATPGLTFVPLQVRAGGRAGSRVVRAREMTQRAGEERRK
jgi:hypothetical protein